MLIEVFKIKSTTKINLHDGTPASCGLQDLVVIVDDDVNVQHYNTFERADLTRKFIHFNPHIFEQLA